VSEGKGGTGRIRKRKGKKVGVMAELRGKKMERDKGKKAGKEQKGVDSV